MPNKLGAVCAAMKCAVSCAKACAIAFALLLSYSTTPQADPAMTTGSMYGAFGPEGQRMREQLWLLPSGDNSIALRATVFRPASTLTQRFPLVVINHGTSEASRLSSRARAAAGAPRRSRDRRTSATANSRQASTPIGDLPPRCRD